MLAICRSLCRRNAGNGNDPELRKKENGSSQGLLNGGGGDVEASLSDCGTPSSQHGLVSRQDSASTQASPGRLRGIASTAVPAPESPDEESREEQEESEGESHVKSDWEEIPKIKRGDRVVLSEGYEFCGDASLGPLKPGDVGEVINDDGTAIPYEVKFQGETWFYMDSALCLDEAPTALASSSTQLNSDAKDTAVVVEGSAEAGEEVEETVAYESLGGSSGSGGIDAAVAEASASAQEAEKAEVVGAEPPPTTFAEAGAQRPEVVVEAGAASETGKDVVVLEPGSPSSSVASSEEEHVTDEGKGREAVGGVNRGFPDFDPPSRVDDATDGGAEASDGMASAAEEAPSPPPDQQAGEPGGGGGSSGGGFDAIVTSSLVDEASSMSSSPGGGKIVEVATATSASEEKASSNTGGNVDGSVRPICEDAAMDHTVKQPPYIGPTSPTVVHVDDAAEDGATDRLFGTGLASNTVAMDVATKELPCTEAASPIVTQKVADAEDDTTKRIPCTEAASPIGALKDADADDDATEQLLGTGLASNVVAQDDAIKQLPCTEASSRINAHKDANADDDATKQMPCMEAPSPIGAYRDADVDDDATEQLHGTGLASNVAAQNDATKHLLATEFASATHAYRDASAEDDAAEQLLGTGLESNMAAQDDATKQMPCTEAASAAHSHRDASAENDAAEQLLGTGLASNMVAQDDATKQFPCTASASAAHAHRDATAEDDAAEQLLGTGLASNMVAQDDAAKQLPCTEAASAAHALRDAVSEDDAAEQLLGTGLASNMAAQDDATKQLLGKESNSSTITQDIVVAQGDANQELLHGGLPSFACVQDGHQQVATPPLAQARKLDDTGGKELMCIPEEVEDEKQSTTGLPAAAPSVFFARGIAEGACAGNDGGSAGEGSDELDGLLADLQAEQPQAPALDSPMAVEAGRLPWQHVPDTPASQPSSGCSDDLELLPDGSPSEPIAAIAVQPPAPGTPALAKTDIAVAASADDNGAAGGIDHATGSRGSLQGSGEDPLDDTDEFGLGPPIGRTKNTQQLAEEKAEKLLIEQAKTDLCSQHLVDGDMEIDEV